MTTSTAQAAECRKALAVADDHLQKGAYSEAADYYALAAMGLRKAAETQEIEAQRLDTDNT